MRRNSAGSLKCNLVQRLEINAKFTFRESPLHTHDRRNHRNRYLYRCCHDHFAQCMENSMV